MRAPLDRTRWAKYPSGRSANREIDLVGPYRPFVARTRPPRPVRALLAG